MPIVLLVALVAPSQWLECQSGTTERLRGVAVADARTAWAVGANGTILRTEDAGATWRSPVKGAEGVDFRDVEALGPRVACVLAVGEGGKSRIFRTEDAGATWSLRYTNPDPKGFLDAMAFFDREHGLAIGDPVNGQFVVLTTEDGGSTWRPLEFRVHLPKRPERRPGTGKGQGQPPEKGKAQEKARRPVASPPEPWMPPALEGEGAFAASGTCLAVSEAGWAWFVTTKGRVFRSEERGRSWAVHETPVRPTSDSSGLFSVVFADRWHGVAAAGDHKQTAAFDGPSLIRTDDGGRTWRAPTGSPVPKGLRSGLAWIGRGLSGPGAEGGAGTLVAVGPDGVDRSSDAGDTWVPMAADGGAPGFHAVAFDPAGRFGIAVGENGRVYRWSAAP